MLDAYDKAREQARIHEVETYHGKVAEAEFRKWLAGFLPKRYAVTSGYIVSPGTFQPGQMSSFYGMGSTFNEMFAERGGSGKS